MKAFVTGGSGFIGQHVVQKLVARGDTVHALARSEESAALLRQLGATVFMGDITDSASLRPGMEGCDVVFHIAAWYKIGAPDWMQAEAINVGGTRRVLRLAHELGIPKIVYTSTVAVFGDTQGQLVDETYYKEGPFLTEYDRTKWLAHYKVALPLIEKGAPIIIVMPGAVYGPGDTSFVAQLMRMFYRGLPVLPDADLTVTYAHVGDIAEGHLLAADKGKAGESYILTGPAIPLNEMVDFWAHLIGRKPPSLRLSGRPLRKFAPLMGAVGSVLPLPEIFSEEAVGSLGATYMARSDKARSELGWTTRPLQTGLLETFDWIARTEPQEAPRQKEKKLAGFALLAAAVLFLFWYLGQRKK
ncbi:MAG: NAD-dependent epimerase/dehydratase family protein [Ardenticatenaceae bacterium]|nr:NAD-dependent epimerase/dehydratase family protein [Ardenticatenaceae bacterium]MCB8948045.1 NAD-dependent epimerase/dehydratase family protein [Ardenticatenaceae bacterium]